MTTCARPGCAATVMWVRTIKGRPMPLDVEPNPAGNVALVDGLAVVLAKDEPHPRGHDASRYMPHWATCADPPPRKAKR